MSYPVIKFLFKNEWKVLSEAILLKEPYQTQDFGAASDLATHISSLNAVLIVAAISNKNDLIQLATLVKLQRTVARETVTKIVVVNYSTDRQIEKAISKLGIMDVLDDRINTKAFRFKIDFWMKALAGQVKKLESQKSNQNLKNVQTSKNTESKNQDQGLKSLPPLELEDDIWLLKSESDCKKILSRWLVKLMGPSPYVGSWVEVTNKSNTWRFDIKNESKELLISGSGSWYFQGDQKPDFIWKENIWLITGDNFHLFYQDKDNSITRLQLLNRIISITKNSIYANTKEQILIDSFDKELVFKKDEESNQENENFENETERLKNISGRSKTDSLDDGLLAGKTKGDPGESGPLSGKNKSENYKEEPLSGSVKQEEGSSGPLSGKGKTHHSSEKGFSLELENGPNSSSDPLSQDASNSELNNWGGKNFKENPLQDKQAGPSVGKHKDGSILDMDADNRKHETYYKNHNATQQYEAKELGQKRSNQGFGEEIASDQDINELEKKDRKDFQRSASDPYTRSEKDRAEKERTSFDESLTSQKEDIEKNSPNDSHNTYERPIAKERSERERSLAEDDFRKQKKDARENSLAADRNPYERGDSKKQPQRERSPFFEKESSDNRGRSSTEQLSSHYKSPNRSSEKNENEKNNVLPLRKEELKKKNEPIPDDPDLAEAVAEAKVLAFLIQGNEKIPCDLNDFFDDTIIFLSKKKLEPALVTLDMSFDYLNKKNKLRFDGNITQVNDDEEGAFFINVSINEMNVKSFEVFMELFKTRQNNVNSFFKKVKGL